MQKYVVTIKSPEIREIYTRLRIDMNTLSSSKSQGDKQLDLCPLCGSEKETVVHFLFRCSQFEHIRLVFYDELSLLGSNINHDDENEKLRYLLNVQCPPEAVGTCCRFLQQIYSRRYEDRST